MFGLSFSFFLIGQYLKHKDSNLDHWVFLILWLEITHLISQSLSSCLTLSLSLSFFVTDLNMISYFFNSLDLYLPQSPPPQPPICFRRPSITTTTTRPFVRRPSITTTTQPRLELISLSLSLSLSLSVLNCIIYFRDGGSKARQVWWLEEEDDGFIFRKRKLTASWWGGDEIRSRWMWRLPPLCNLPLKSHDEEEESWLDTDEGHGKTRRRRWWCGR